MIDVAETKRGAVALRVSRQFRQAYGEVGNVPIKTVFAPTISYATLLKTFTAMEADHG